jgi:putative ABC transport system permease protein
MIKNYFKIAWRNILKNKTFSLINITGLAVSMSVCLLIIMVIADQKSYDQFHNNKDRIYRVLTTGKNQNQMKDMASSALPLSEELRKNHTGIESAASLVRGIGGDMVYNDKIASGGGYFADGNLFKILNFKLAQGDAKTALENPRSLVIAEELSKQLFYNENPIGKTVKFTHTGINPMGVDNGNQEKNYGLFTITGILKPLEGKTHLPFKLLASLSTLNALKQDSVIEYSANDWEDIWDNYTYILLEKGKKQAELQQILDKISDKQYPKAEFSQYAFKAEPLSIITPSHPKGNDTNLFIPRFVLVFLGILCLIVMLSACFNYTNLSVARSLTRAKEVGIRKVSGATRKHIFMQFIAESTLISLISLAFSICFLMVLEYLFSNLIINKYINITFQHTIGLYAVFIAFSIVVGMIAGVLPAFYMSSFNPIQILKNINQIKIFKRLTLRKILLVTQFSISLIFIISTVLIYLQTHHILNFNYGFNKDNVVNIKLYKPENYNRFAQAITANKDITTVSACDILPAGGSSNGTMIHINNGKDSLTCSFIDIDAKCIDVWDLKLIAGKNLPDMPSVNDEKYVLINEKAVQDFDFKSPQQAVGQPIMIGNDVMEVAGVVKDFQAQNVTRRIERLVLRNRAEQFRHATIKISGKNTPETIAFLQETWRKVNPTTKFEYEFYDDQLRMVHTIFQNVANIIGFIAFLAVFIACLGLLGMATYTAETRQKEIGIRKVLGSSILQIILLLSKNFIVLLGIAILIATPISYFLNKIWLEFFASRVSINAFTILSSILILLLISLLIVFSQAWKAAVANPVKSLRTE